MSQNSFVKDVASGFLIGQDVAKILFTGTLLDVVFAVTRLHLLGYLPSPPENVGGGGEWGSCGLQFLERPFA